MTNSRSAAVHRTIVAVDVESFGDPRRTNAHQSVVRHGMYSALKMTFSRCGIPWKDSYREDRGDGALILLPPDVTKNRLVESFPHELAAALREHNALHGNESRIRLRIALNAGEVHFDTYGVVGTSINHTFRLLEASELKSALANSRGVLAIITSSRFYDEVVRHSAASNPDGYFPALVSVKETTGTAWIHLPDGRYQQELSDLASHPLPEWSKFAIVDHEELFGVDESIERIGKLLSNQDGDRVISIFGSPGAGKTTLAYESVKRHARSAGFRRISWISAKLAQLTSLGNIERTQRAIVEWKDILSDIAGQLHLNIDVNPILIEEELEHALAEAGKFDRYLIVVDNLETVQDVQFAVRFLEKEAISRPHKVVLTSRQSVMPYSRRAHEVRWDGLTPQAAGEYAAYLLQDDASMGLTPEDLDDLVQASECNPLLIKLIVRLAMFERKPVREIVSALHNVHADLGDSVASYLYAGSLTALDSQVGTDTAVKLMNVFCARAPGESFTAEEFYRLSRLTSRESFDRAKAAACQLALVRTLQNNTRFTVHSLLREFVCSEPTEVHFQDPQPTD